MQGDVIAQTPISQCINHTHEEAKGHFGQEWHSVLATTNQLRDKALLPSALRDLLHGSFLGSKLGFRLDFGGLVDSR
jgi:hypothetical protein